MPLLEERNLRALTQATDYRTRTQRQLIGQSLGEMRQIENDAEEIKHSLSAK